MLSERGEFLSSVVTWVSSRLYILKYDVIATPISKKLVLNSAKSKKWFLLNLFSATVLVLFLIWGCRIFVLELRMVEKVVASAVQIPGLLILDALFFFYFLSEEIMENLNAIYELDVRMGKTLLTLKPFLAILLMRIINFFS